jgi:hypothetical protein
MKLYLNGSKNRQQKIKMKAKMETKIKKIKKINKIKKIRKIIERN